MYPNQMMYHQPHMNVAPPRFPSVDRLEFEQYPIDPSNPPQANVSVTFPTLTPYIPLLAYEISKEIMENANKNPLRRWLYNTVAVNGFRNPDFDLIVTGALLNMAYRLWVAKNVSVYEDAVKPATEAAIGYFLAECYHTVPELPNYVKLDRAQSKIMFDLFNDHRNIRPIYEQLKREGSVPMNYQNQQQFNPVPQPTGYPQQPMQQPVGYPNQMHPQMQQSMMYPNQIQTMTPGGYQSAPMVHQPMYQPMHQPLHQPLYQNQQFPMQPQMQHQNMSQVQMGHIQPGMQAGYPPGNTIAPRRNAFEDRDDDYQSPVTQNTNQPTGHYNPHAPQNQQGVVSQFSIEPEYSPPEVLQPKATPRTPQTSATVQPTTTQRPVQTPVQTPKTEPLFTTTDGVKYYDMDSGLVWQHSEEQTHRPIWNTRRERPVYALYPDGRVRIHVVELDKEAIMNYDQHKTTRVIQHEHMKKLEEAARLQSIQAEVIEEGEGDERYTVTVVPEYRHIKEDIGAVVSSVESYVLDHEFDRAKLQVESDSDVSIYTTTGAVLEIHANMGKQANEILANVMSASSFGAARNNLQTISDSIEPDDLGSMRVVSLINRRLTDKVNDVLRVGLGLVDWGIESFLTDYEDLLAVMREELGQTIVSGFLQGQKNHMLACLCTGTNDQHVQVLESLGIDPVTSTALSGTTAVEVLSQRGMLVIMRLLTVSTINCDLEDLEIDLGETKVGVLRKEASPVLYDLAMGLLDDRDATAADQLNVLVRTLDGAELQVCRGRLNREHLVVRQR